MPMRRIAALAFSLTVLFLPLSASADPVRDRQYWLEDYGFSKAWSLTRGEGVVVAVIDTGIDASHPALRDTVIGGTDVSGLGSSDGLTPVGQNSYHGTLVASIIAGQGNPLDQEAGVIGVAPGVKLLSVSMAFGVEDLDTDSQIAQGVIWAVDNGAQVINLSLTRNSTSWPKSWDAAFQYAFDNDVVIVAATGNRVDGTESISAPATIPGVISVAGLDREGRASELSSLSGFTIALTAPSEDLVGAYPGGEYRIWQGTSGAAPMVSGLVALIRSEFPNMNAANVINRVISSANKAGFSGYSTAYGYGSIDAYSALTIELPIVSENPLGSLSQWVELYRAQSEVESGGIVSPIDDPIQELAQAQPGFGPEMLVPYALYAGLGILALLLYFLFRPRSKPSTRK
ncbi:MAG: S8 family serine peptidase [Actinomycetota bacterium]